MVDNNDPYRYRTINTFTRKPGIAQLASYLIFSAMVATFYACILPEVANEMIPRITMHVVYPISLAVLIALTLASSIIDPTDSVVIECKRCRS